MYGAPVYQAGPVRAGDEVMPDVTYVAKQKSRKRRTGTSGATPRPGRSKTAMLWPSYT